VMDILSTAADDLSTAFFVLGLFWEINIFFRKLVHINP
jgi:hypothetical protein